MIQEIVLYLEEVGIPSNFEILEFYEEHINGNRKKVMNLRSILKNERILWYQIQI